MDKKITQKYLKEILHYNPDTGVFTWKVRKHRRRKNGVVGHINPFGYLTIGIDGKCYQAHRLAWFYVYGEFPRKSIDHINHDKLDSKISNLRVITQTENSRNCSISKSNKSGITGVHWNKKVNKWCAQIMVNYKNKFLGHFENIEDARQSRKEAEIEYGFHKNHGVAELLDS